MKNWIVTILLVLQISCIESEEIDKYVKSHGAKVVIDGVITTERKRHEVKLTLSQSYGNVNDASAVEYITGANVNITDGSSLFVMNEVSPGIYLTDTISGEVGKSYILTVSVNGTSYIGTDTLIGLTSKEPLDVFEVVEGGTSIDFENRKHQFGFDMPNKYEFSMTIPQSVLDNETDPFIREILRRAKPRDFEIFTHPGIEPTGVFDFEATEFVRYVRGRISVTQKKYSISDRYYSFLRSVFLETDWRGSILDSRPASPQGNMSNGALGYFRAQDVDSLTFFP